MPKVAAPAKSIEGGKSPMRAPKVVALTESAESGKSCVQKYRPALLSANDVPMYLVKALARKGLLGAKEPSTSESCGSESARRECLQQVLH